MCSVQYSSESDERAKMSEKAKEILEKVRARDPNQTEFLQAVEEVIESLEPLFASQPKYLNVSHNF